MVTGLSFTGQRLIWMRRNTGCDWLRIPVTHVWVSKGKVSFWPEKQGWWWCHSLRDNSWSRARFSCFFFFRGCGGQRYWIWVGFVNGARPLECLLRDVSQSVGMCFWVLRERSGLKIQSWVPAINCCSLAGWWYHRPVFQWRHNWDYG